MEKYHKSTLNKTKYGILQWDIYSHHNLIRFFSYLILVLLVIKFKRHYG